MAELTGRDHTASMGFGRNNHVGPGERYDLVFTAANPGLWLFHCNVVPHATNDGAYPGGLLIPVITEAKKKATVAENPAHSHS